VPLPGVEIAATLVGGLSVPVEALALPEPDDVQ
jgi:hypothetical protein